MGTLLKGVQSVLIALGIIAVIGTGVVVYYNTVKPPEDETAAIETQSGTETETAAETDSSDAAGTGNETETDGVTDPTMVPVSNGGTASDTFTPENGHEHTYTSTVLRPASCTEQGEVKYECYCGDFYVDSLPALEHNKGEWITVRSATTTQTGLRQKSCTLCGRSLEEETIPMLTASSDASNKDSKKKDTDDDHRHTYTYEITSEASCTEKGEKTYTCTICGSTFKTSIPATNHPSRRTVRSDGNCANDGTIETVCNLCDAVISSESLHYDHQWSSWSTTTEPTTTAAGVRTRTCKKCGEQQTRSIAKLPGGSNSGSNSGGSNSGNNSGGSNSGNNSGGSNSGNNSGTSHTHSYNSVVTVQPTCTEPGTTTSTCSCGDTRTEAKPEALGHKPKGEWVTTKPATTTEEGEQVQYCARCGEIALTQKLSKLPEVHTHTWDDSRGIILRKPTCTETGSRRRTCTTCGYWKLSTIDALGHTYYWRTETEATNTTPGLKVEECSVCGTKSGRTEEIPATGGGTTPAPTPPGTGGTTPAPTPPGTGGTP